MRKVSVCIATYNGEKYISEQINSILPQLSNHDEIVVSDDGSTDTTIEIIVSFHDDRIKLFHNNQKHGVVYNFENALIHSQGDVIFLSDQDDIWQSDKVKNILPLFDNYDLVIHDAQLIDGDGNSLGKTYYSTLHHKTGFWANLWKTRWLGCCMAFKRNVLEECLPFPSNIVGHDYWIGMLGMIKFRYCFLDDILIYYRRHGGNVSSSSEKSRNSWLYKIFTKRFNLIIAIFKRVLLKRKR